MRFRTVSTPSDILHTVFSHFHVLCNALHVPVHIVTLVVFFALRLVTAALNNDHHLVLVRTRRSLLN